MGPGPGRFPTTTPPPEEPGNGNPDPGFAFDSLRVRTHEHLADGGFGSKELTGEPHNLETLTLSLSLSPSLSQSPSPIQRPLHPPRPIPQLLQSVSLWRVYYVYHDPTHTRTSPHHNSL